MKKKIVLFLAVLLCIISIAPLSACGKSKKMSKTILKDTVVDLSNVSAFGVATASSSSASNLSLVSTADTKGKITKLDNADSAHFVKLKDNGEIEEVVFKKANGKEVKQNQIGKLDNFYSVGEFTFVRFTIYEQINLQYHNRMVNDDYFQSFAIHNSTGKVYALQDLIEGNNAIYVFDGVFCVEVYATTSNVVYTYKVTIDNENKMILDDILPNKDISFYFDLKDKFGTLFVTNDSLNFIDSEKRVVYYKSVEPMTPNSLYHRNGHPIKGDDGHVYFLNYEDGITYVNHDITIKYCNQNMEIIGLPDNCSVNLIDNYGEFFGRIEDNYLVLNKYSECELYENKDGVFKRIEPYNLYSGDLIAVNGELFTIKSVNSKNTLYKVDFTGFDTGNITAVEQELYTATNITYNKGAFYAKDMTLYGTKTYQLTWDGTQMNDEMIGSADYKGEILIINPIN